MLMYFVNGCRTYKRRPTDVLQRSNWEFYLVLTGAAAPYFSEGEKETPVCHRLWLLPPGISYSWWSNKGPVERIVFHFSAIDASLRQLFETKKFLYADLKPKEVDFVRSLAEEIKQHYLVMSVLSPLYFNRALAELSLLVGAPSLAHAENASSLCTRHQVIANKALAYFSSQLPKRPLVEEVAATVGVSAAHLRRIFHEIYGLSPKSLFLSAQIDCAKRIAAVSEGLTDDIARQSGFASAPHFCHAFHQLEGTTFLNWRKQIAADPKVISKKANNVFPGIYPYPPRHK